MGTAVEHIDGGALSVSPGVAESKRTFIMSGYPSQGSVVDVLGERINTTYDPSTDIVIPKIGDRHPDFPAILFAHAYELSKVPKSDGMWRLTFTYRFNEPTSFSTDITRGPDAIGFTETTARLTGKFDLCYRADPDFGANIPDNDIGGEPVDVNGEPTSIMRVQYEIQFNVTVNDTIQEILGTFGDQVGAVCGGPVFGLPGETVLYRGASISRIAQNAYRLTHTYLYDQWYHTIQTPDYTLDGQIELDEDGHCKTVFAIAPFPVGSAQTFIQGI